MASKGQHVVAGHSTCGWTTKQVEDLPTGSQVVMCDQTPDDKACKDTKAYPTHFVCSSSSHDSCKEIGKGYKPATELQALINSSM